MNTPSTENNNKAKSTSEKQLPARSTKSWSSADVDLEDKDDVQAELYREWHHKKPKRRNHEKKSKKEAVAGGSSTMSGDEEEN